MGSYFALAFLIFSAMIPGFIAKEPKFKQEIEKNKTENKIVDVALEEIPGKMDERSGLTNMREKPDMETIRDEKFPEKTQSRFFSNLFPKILFFAKVLHAYRIHCCISVYLCGSRIDLRRVDQ
jgi:hypothetical protein